MSVMTNKTPRRASKATVVELLEIPTPVGFYVLTPERQKAALAKSKKMLLDAERDKTAKSGPPPPPFSLLLSSVDENKTDDQIVETVSDTSSVTGPLDVPSTSSTISSSSDSFDVDLPGSLLNSTFTPPSKSISEEPIKAIQIPIEEKIGSVESILNTTFDTPSKPVELTLVKPSVTIISNPALNETFTTPTRSKAAKSALPKISSPAQASGSVKRLQSPFQRQNSRNITDSLKKGKQIILKGLIKPGSVKVASPLVHREKGAFKFGEKNDPTNDGTLFKFRMNKNDDKIDSSPVVMKPTPSKVKGAPDFSVVHARQNEKMLSIDAVKKHVDERAKLLMSGKKTKMTSNTGHKEQSQAVKSARKQLQMRRPLTASNDSAKTSENKEENRKAMFDHFFSKDKHGARENHSAKLRREFNEKRMKAHDNKRVGLFKATARKQK